MLSLIDLPIVNLVPGSKFQIVHLYGLTLRNSHFRQTRNFSLAMYISMQVVSTKDVPLEC